MGAVAGSFASTLSPGLRPEFWAASSNVPGPPFGITGVAKSFGIHCDGPAVSPADEYLDSL